MFVGDLLKAARPRLVTIADDAKRMKARQLKNISLVDGHKGPIGVLTARAILRVLLGEPEHEEAQLVDYVTGVGYG